MRTSLSVVAGVFGLWLFTVGLSSVFTTARGSFLPARWSDLPVGALLFAGAALLWRHRTPQRAGQRAPSNSLRSFFGITTGLFGLCIFLGGLRSVVNAQGGSFLPTGWSDLLVGAVLFTGGVLLWRHRTPSATGQPAAAADGAGGA